MAKPLKVPFRQWYITEHNIAIIWVSKTFLNSTLNNENDRLISLQADKTR